MPAKFQRAYYTANVAKQQQAGLTHQDRHLCKNPTCVNIEKAALWGKSLSKIQQNERVSAKLVQRAYYTANVAMNNRLN